MAVLSAIGAGLALVGAKKLGGWLFGKMFGRKQRAQQRRAQQAATKKGGVKTVTTPGGTEITQIPKLPPEVEKKLDTDEQDSEDLSQKDIDDIIFGRK